MVCPCLYPLVFIDNRNGDGIEYISIPGESFDEIEDKPEFEEVEEEGFDGKRHRYMGVMWRNPQNAITKKYDVNNHVVIAGCNAKTDGKKMSCKKKELYIVLHPIDEWEEHHIIKIR